MSILIELKRRVLHLTLNRQKKRNALTAEMCSVLVDAIAEAQSKPEVGSILISSIGSVFCSGMDLDEASQISPKALADVHERLFTMGANSIKPIVVSVNGAALGGGLGLAAQGHIVIAGHGAAFGLPEIRVGLWPFLVFRAVEHALGPRRTLELSLTGRNFHVQDALQWGLVHYVCQTAELQERADVSARELAKASPEAIQAGLLYFRESRYLQPDESGQLARKLRAEVMDGLDFKEGYEAFKTRREPHWPAIPAEFYSERI